MTGGDDGTGSQGPVLGHRARVEAGGRTVRIAFTDRSLDLSESPTSDRAVLEAALDEVRGATGFPVARMHQVHGGEVAEVDRVPDEPPRADALVTSATGLVLMARAADCVPVLLADRGGRAVAAAHCGRPGLVAGVVPAALRALREQGAEHVMAWIGPHVCGSCYEVPAGMRDEVSAAVPEARAETRWGTPALDIGAGVRAQLVAAGCEVEQVPGCTLEDARFPSHRRDGGDATRFAGLVWTEPAGDHPGHTETDEEV